jgi:pyruvate-formate lyase
MINRTEKLRSRLYQNTPEICLERARLYTDNWLETEGKPIVVRRAMALAKILRVTMIRRCACPG